MPNDINKIAAARRIMWDELEADPDLMLVYEANVAMLLYDELHARGYTPKLKYDDRNEIAARLLKLLFAS